MFGFSVIWLPWLGCFVGWCVACWCDLVCLFSGALVGFCCGLWVLLGFGGMVVFSRWFGLPGFVDFVWGWYNTGLVGLVVFGLVRVAGFGILWWFLILRFLGLATVFSRWLEFGCGGLICVGLV